MTKDADGMAKCAGPDQTASQKQPNLGLHCLPRLKSTVALVCTKL